MEQLNMFGNDYINESIKLIKEFEQVSLSRNPLGYIVGYSGGKDSDVLLDLFIKSKVKFHVIHNHTTIDTMGGGNKEPKIIQLAEPIAYDEQNQYLRTDGTVGTITTDGSSPKHNNRVIIPDVENNDELDLDKPFEIISVKLKTQTIGAIKQNNNIWFIRKLTPKETWRLMGFTDSDFDKAKESGVSNSQLYKQAGNSIVVPVLEAILRNLF